MFTEIYNANCLTRMIGAKSCRMHFRKVWLALSV